MKKLATTDRVAIRRALTEGCSMRSTSRMAGVSINTVTKLLASSGNIFSAEELELLRERGAGGDICLRFFDRQGEPLLTPLNERVIGMRLEQLQKVARSVGIAGGQRKLHAIRGALLGHWINVLITDRRTAEALVEEVRAPDAYIASIDHRAAASPEGGASA